MATSVITVEEFTTHHQRPEKQCELDTIELPELHDSSAGEEADVGVERLVNLATIEPVPPNGGYAWICTLSVFLINAHTWGINSSWAVFMAFLESNPDRIDASHFEYALIGGFSISQALIISPIVTFFRKHIGMRWTMLLGTALIFASLITSSLATKFWHLLLSQGFCFGWGMGLIYIPASAVLPPWFSTRRSLAVGIATSGAGLGGLAYSLVTNRVIQDLGFAWTYRILAVCSVAANLPASLMLRESGGRSQSSLQELKLNLRDFGQIQVILIIFWGVATELGYITLLYSIPSYASSIGLTATQGSIANALLNLGLGLGRPLVGYYSDILGRINMALAMTILCTILCFALWVPAHSFAPLAAFSLLAGPLCGTFWTTLTPVLVEVVGMKQLASTFSVICLSLVVPTNFAESVAMQLVTDDGESKSFLNAQLFVGCMFLAGSISLWMLRSWKIFMTENEDSRTEQPSGLQSKLRIAWLHPRLFFRFWHV